MNPMLAPRVAPSAGSIGRTPAACDTAIAIGMIILAAAVFEVVSDRTMAVPVNITVSATVPGDGSHDVMPCGRQDPAEPIHADVVGSCVVQSGRDQKRSSTRLTVMPHADARDVLFGDSDARRLRRIGPGTEPARECE